jgi:hypothetical protein
VKEKRKHPGACLLGDPTESGVCERYNVNLSQYMISKFCNKCQFGTV